MNTINLGGYNDIKNEEVKTGFVNMSDLERVNNSGVYDCEIQSAVLGKHKNKDGADVQCITLGLSTSANGVAAGLYVSVDTPPSQFAYHLKHLALLTNCMDAQGNIVLTPKEVPFKLPTADGRTSMTTFPCFEHKMIKVAVKRSGESKTSGIPYTNLVYFFDIDGHSAFERIQQDPSKTKLNEVLGKLVPEGNANFKLAPKTTGAYGAGRIYNPTTQTFTPKPQQQQQISAPQQQFTQAPAPRQQFGGPASQAMAQFKQQTQSQLYAPQPQQQPQVQAFTDDLPF